MKRLLNRTVFSVGAFLFLSLGMSCHSNSSTAQAPPVAKPQPVAADPPALPSTIPSYASSFVLETQALQAARTGDFDRSDLLLDQAAKISRDPELHVMQGWISDFEAQRQTFAAARHTQFEKDVANVHLLLNHKLDSYAIDEAATASLLTDDKDEFRHEAWIDALIKESASGADTDESAGLWLKAMRMYQDLSLLEPANPVWKNKLKLATLRVRLLLIYTPARLHKLQETELHDRQVADDLLHPTTEPSQANASTTRPGDNVADAVGVNPPALAIGATTQPDAGDDALSSADWHDVTKGIEFDMLLDALELAAHQYYRDVTFQGLLQGGLGGLETVVTTDGLEDAFPGLKDRNNHKKFLDEIEVWKAKADLATPDTAEEVMAEALSDLRDLNLKTVKLPEEVFVSEFADGAFSRLDLFSTVVWPYDVPELEKTTEGEFSGVGIQITNNKAGDVEVVQPLPDSPALRAGIRIGDVIMRIDGKSAKGLSADGAVKVITGDPGTMVKLTMRSLGGTVKDFNLRREMIKVASIKGCTPTSNGGWNYMLDPDQKIGYIRLTSFSKTTGEDLGNAIDVLKSQNARAIILDLRYNPGGLLDTAKKVVNKFIDHGLIVSTHPDRPTVTANPPVVMTADPDDLQTTVPLVVLVNQYSASASEIVSGALKDDKRALIVGERTYGKGSVQMLFPLEEKKAYLKLTTSHYYLPSGRCIHREENSTTWGVDPDVTVEMTPRQMNDQIDARQHLDVPSSMVDGSTTRPSAPPTINDVLKVDPQLSAALLILRLQLASQKTPPAQAAAR